MAHLEPLRMLVEHGIDNVDEGLIAGEEPVTSDQKVPFEPLLALMLAEHLHDPAVRGQVVVIRNALGHPGAVGDLQDILPAVGVVFVRTEH